MIFPGGSARTQFRDLGADGRQAVRRFVRDGGGYVGLCAGAFSATSNYGSGMSLINAAPVTGSIDVPGVGQVSAAARGAGTVRIELIDAGKRVFVGFPDLMDIRYSGGPIFSPAGNEDLPMYVTLAVFRTEVWEYEAQRGRMVGTPAIIAARFGKGRVMVVSPHPEMTPGLESLTRWAILATAGTRTRCLDDREIERGASRLTESRWRVSTNERERNGERSSDLARGAKS